jgi:hypothetical protein
MAKKNFGTHQGRDQECLLIKQSKDRKIAYNPDTDVGTSDNRCNEYSSITGIYGEKGVGIWLQLTLGKVVPFDVTPGIFNIYI